MSGYKTLTQSALTNAQNKKELSAEEKNAVAVASLVKTVSDYWKKSHSGTGSIINFQQFCKHLYLPGPGGTVQKAKVFVNQGQNSILNGIIESIFPDADLTNRDQLVNKLSNQMLHCISGISNAETFEPTDPGFALNMMANKIATTQWPDVANEDHVMIPIVRLKNGIPQRIKTMEDAFEVALNASITKFAEPRATALGYDGSPLLKVDDDAALNYLWSQIKLKANVGLVDPKESAEIIDPMVNKTGTARFTDINSVNDGYRFESVADAMNRADTIRWEYDYNDYPAHANTLDNRIVGGPGSKLAEDQLNTIVCGQSVIGIEMDGSKKVFREIQGGNLDNRPYIMLSNDEKAPFTFDYERSSGGFTQKQLFINPNIVTAAKKKNAYIYAINCLSKPGLDSELFGECRAQGVAHVQSMILYNCSSINKASDKNIHCNSAGYGYGLSHQIGCASTAQDAVNVCRPRCQGGGAKSGDVDCISEINNDNIFLNEIIQEEFEKEKGYESGNIKTILEKGDDVKFEAILKEYNTWLGEFNESKKKTAIIECLVENWPGNTDKVQLKQKIGNMIQNFIDQQLIQMNGLISLFEVNKQFEGECKNELKIKGGGGKMSMRHIQRGGLPWFLKKLGKGIIKSAIGTLKLAGRIITANNTKYLQAPGCLVQRGIMSFAAQAAQQVGKRIYQPLWDMVHNDVQGALYSPDSTFYSRVMAMKNRQKKPKWYPSLYIIGNAKYRLIPKGTDDVCIQKIATDGPGTVVERVFACADANASLNAGFKNVWGIQNKIFVIKTSTGIYLMLEKSYNFLTSTKYTSMASQTCDSKAGINCSVWMSNLFAGILTMDAAGGRLCCPNATTTGNVNAQYVANPLGTNGFDTTLKKDIKENCGEKRNIGKTQFNNDFVVGPHCLVGGNKRRSTRGRARKKNKRVTRRRR